MMTSKSKTPNFFVQNSKLAWKKQSSLDKKFGVRNFHLDSYKNMSSKNNSR